MFSFLFDSWTRGPNTRTTPPTRPAGESGTAVYGGYLVEHERSQRLIGRSRYHTYGTMIANAPIIAAGIRLYATLVAGSQWSMTPAEADGSQAWADRAEQCVYGDPMQSWPRVIRRAAMYRYYGYSIQEWTMRKVDDGSLTFDRIDPRPQVTIERWDLDVTARTPLAGVVQLSEQSGDELYIARSKLLYLVDDALSDSPEGLGLLRQCVAPFDRLMRYYQLEGLGYETDLRGIPVGRVPFSENAKRIASGQLSPQQAKDAEQVVTEFVGRHIRTAQLGLVLDSAPYRKPDTSPTTDAEYGMEILKGSGTSHEAIEKAIERTTAELARIQSAEGLLLGSTSSGGAYALAKNKTANLHAAVNSALVEVRDGAQRDLVDTLWTLNMWPRTSSRRWPSSPCASKTSSTRPAR